MAAGALVLLVIESLHAGERRGIGTLVIFVWTALTTVAANFGRTR